MLKLPRLTNKDLYEAFPKANKTTIRSAANRVRDKYHLREIDDKKGKNDASKSSPKRKEKEINLEDIIENIENPVAFAMSFIFKKMVQTGDVRYAQLYVSLLDKTNKLDYETQREQEWLSQAKNMTMEEIVSQVAIKGTTSKNISRRLEELENTLPYDSS